MAEELDFDIPELNRIGTLMRDLMSDEEPRGRQPNRRAGNARRKFTQGKSLGGHTLGRLGDAFNWKNTQGFVSPLMVPLGQQTQGKRMGGLTVAALSQGINWRNALDGPQMLTGAAVVAPASPDAGPPETLDVFFDEMKWD
ncbi:MAG: hypothetical protein ACRCZF_17205 [Gemmataceae bacterium]